MFQEKSFFEKLRKPRTLTLLFTLVVAVALSLYFYMDVSERMGVQELKESIRLEVKGTSWVDKPGPEGRVKIVPSIVFKVTNVGERPLRHLGFTGLFDLADSGKRLGDGTVYALSRPLPPGQTSGEIVINSANGYTASSKRAFETNAGDWKPVTVKVFARTAAGFVDLGVYLVKKVISGNDMPRH